MSKSRLLFILVCTISISIILTSSCVNAKEPRTELIISAAVSLKDSLLAIQPAYEKSHPGIKLIFNFGSSGTLQQQIEQGAPADLFISAGVKQMKTLIDNGFIDAKDQTILLSNDLVLVMPTNTSIKLDNSTCRELVKKEFKFIAMGIPESVPAGSYAKETLEWLKIYETLLPKIVQAKDVRQVLTYVETGNADAGFVYRTDALSSKRVKIVLTIDKRAHKPIIYPAGIIKESGHLKEARLFYQYIQGKAASEIFLQYGFKLPAAS